MAHRGSKDLEEKLSAWGAHLDDQGHSEEHVHKAHEGLNEKLAQWGASVDEPSEDVQLSPKSREKKHRKSSHKDEKRKSGHHEEGHDKGRHSSSGVDKEYVDEKLSAWGRSIDDQDDKGGEHQHHILAGTDKLFDELTHGGSIEVEVD